MITSDLLRQFSGMLRVKQLVSLPRLQVVKHRQQTVCAQNTHPACALAMLS